MDSLAETDREELKAIYRLSRDGEAHTGVLAERLGLSPGTVTATIKRLADRGLVDHKPYKGVELTADGSRAALASMRRHRIIERFLADMLGYAWNEADRLAAEGGYQTFYLHGGEWLILLASVATALLALIVGFFLMRGVLAEDEGTEKMKEIAKAIQEGAMAYLRRQFKTIAVILVPLAIIVFVTSTKVRTDSLSHVPGRVALTYAQSGLFRTAAFVLGCFMSALTGFIGMSLAVRGNVRTAAAAKRGSMPAALQVAFRTGGVAGMVTVGLGLLGASLIIIAFQNTSSAILIGFGFCGSLLALLLRVGGGILTTG